MSAGSANEVRPRNDTRASPTARPSQTSVTFTAFTTTTTQRSARAWSRPALPESGIVSPKRDGGRSRHDLSDRACARPSAGGDHRPGRAPRKVAEPTSRGRDTPSARDTTAHRGMPAAMPRPPSSGTACVCCCTIEPGVATTPALRASARAPIVASSRARGGNGKHERRAHGTTRVARRARRQHDHGESAAAASLLRASPRHRRPRWTCSPRCRTDPRAVRPSRGEPARASSASSGRSGARSTTYAGEISYSSVTSTSSISIRP